jgi:hypothetical protein
LEAFLETIFQYITYHFCSDFLYAGQLLSFSGGNKENSGDDRSEEHGGNCKTHIVLARYFLTTSD